MKSLKNTIKDKADREDIIRQIKPTLIGYISFLETDDTCDYEINHQYEKQSEKAIVKALIESIKKNVFKEYSLKNLIQGYIKHRFEYDSEDYNKQKAFFKIDFDKDITEKLLKRTEDEDCSEIVWSSYTNIYAFLQSILFSSIEENEFIYLNREVEMPFSPTMKFITDLNLPKSIQKKFLSDSEYRKEKLIDFAKTLVEILYFDKPLCDCETYFIRNNFGDESFSEIREEFFDKNQIGILVNDERKDWERLENGEKILDSKSTFIRSWFTLQNKVSQKNVIVVASYPNQTKYKIGLIPKGSKFSERKINLNAKIPQSLKIFQLDNAVEIDKRDTQIFNALIPQQNTLSPIHKRKNLVVFKYGQRGDFYKGRMPIALENLSENPIELLCAEWLRSDFVSKENRIKAQLLKVGGNNAKTDIVGFSEDGNKISAQVSYTNNKAQINKKISNLLTTKAHKYFMFCLENEDIENEYAENRNVSIISIENVFEDLKNDDFYRQVVEELINN